MAGQNGNGEEGPLLTRSELRKLATRLQQEIGADAHLACVRATKLREVAASLDLLNDDQLDKVHSLARLIQQRVETILAYTTTVRKVKHHG